MNEISPAMMPAVAYRKSLPVDEPDSLLDVELPVPQPGPRDLLVQVEAIAVNPVDYKIRQSADPGGELRVLGWDAAGTVAAVGGHVELFQAGDEVYYSGALDRLADAGILTCAGPTACWNPAPRSARPPSPASSPPDAPQPTTSRLSNGPTPPDPLSIGPTAMVMRVAVDNHPAE
jgi:hypothetical protein